MDNWKIWKKGAYLTEAHIHFGDKDTVENYYSYRGKSAVEYALDQVEENLKRGLEGLDLLKGLAKPDTDRKKIAEKLRQDLKDAFLRNVMRGVLIGYGFSVPRRAEDEPQKVPVDLWNQYRNSSSNILKSSSLKMEEVRVAHSSWLNVVISAYTKPAGRPTRQDHIVESFETLADQDSIDFSKPATACYGMVRQWVLNNYPDEENRDKGLSTKAMEKHINPLFRQYKMDSL
ncbi:MAG: hypothetical protein COB93_00375 [Sneathiella sp.]|nr:MAG: hypothetical protein COB93_00375 [Sneathiella sp.]